MPTPATPKNADRDADAARRLEKRLAREPYRYEFFQAVRLLHRLAAESEPGVGRKPVGHDFPPGDEILRFTTLASHSFPPGEISKLEPPPDRKDADEAAAGPHRMEVSFLGLTGPAGALPQHYTQTILDRQRHRDATFRRFLDLFNHRFISLFYRAWEKYHVPAILESPTRDPARGDSDPFTFAVYCLAGLGTAGTRDRLEFTDRVFLHYSGLFAQYPRAGITLERLVADFLDEPVELEQFQGQWLSLSTADQTRLNTSPFGRGANNRLGESAIAGERVWSMDTRFRIRLGPLSYEAFCSLLPGGKRLVPLSQLIRTFAGPELDFDIQPVLNHNEVPPCELDATATNPPQLGFNTWICSIPKTDDADDAVFTCLGMPGR